jgi:hypothetical protein
MWPSRLTHPTHDRHSADLDQIKAPCLGTRQRAMIHCQIRNYGFLRLRSGGMQVRCRGFAGPSISHNFKRDLLSLIEPLHPGAFDRADVHEDIPAAIIWLDKSVALLAIEPLNDSLRHLLVFQIAPARGGTPGPGDWTRGSGLTAGVSVREAELTECNPSPAVCTILLMIDFFIRKLALSTRRACRPPMRYFFGFCFPKAASTWGHCGLDIARE